MLTPATTPPRLITLILLSGAAPLTLNMSLPSLAHIAEDFDASYALVSLSISGYLAMTAVVQLIAGPLSDRLGRRPVMLFVLSLFTLASIGCTLAPNVTLFLIFRMLQAGMISGYAISLAVTRDILGDSGAAKRIAQIGMAMAIVPMVGPVFGGMLDTLFGWRSGFMLYTAIGIGLLILAYLDMGETRAHAATRLPALGLLKLPAFWAPTISVAFSVGGFFTFVSIAPLAATNAYGLNGAELGVLIGSITIGFAIGNWIVSRARRAPEVLMVMGRISTCVGIALSTLVLITGLPGAITFFAPMLLVGFGNGLTIPSANASLLAAAPGRAGGAAGLSGAMTVGAGAAITGLAGALASPETARADMLAMMTVISAIALLAALANLRIVRRHRAAG
ncbi:hypothetical protein ATO6_05060 [Oceanicola sp. 22II-s10i]|nr:hypothetical protein ATO6_05060 [Oceanicola sp. 22II-s10i]